MGETTPKKPDCRECYEKQIRELAVLCRLDDATLDRMLAIKDEVLAGMGGERIRPDRMGELLGRVTPLLGTDDPYRDIKREYNQLMLDREQECAARIEAADEPFQLALRYAVAGNLVDFGGKNAFTRDDVTALIDRVPEISFAVDDSAVLLDAVRSARAIMYLGDNCGEIVLDKLVVEILKEQYPHLAVTVIVRAVLSLVAVAAFPVHAAAVSALPALTALALMPRYVVCASAFVRYGVRSGSGTWSAEIAPMLVRACCCCSAVSVCGS